MPKKSKITVSDMLKETRNKKWVLPNFQREFVWTADQVASLFDSMAHGYPIGAIILLKYRREYLFKARGLDGKEGAGQTHQFYIIDGQQRMTSLHKIISEHANQFTPDVEVNYLSLIKNKSNLGTPQNFAFFFKYDTNSIKDKYIHFKKQTSKPPAEEWIKENGFIPLEYVFCNGHTLNTYLKKHNIISKKATITKFKNRILKYELTIKQCEANWKMDEYRTVFERLNKAGTNLSAFDECASLLSKQKFNLHEKWRNISSSPNYSFIGKLDVDPMYILKTMFVINEINDRNSIIHAPSLNYLKKYFTHSNLAEIKSLWNDSVKYVNIACKRLIIDYGVLDKRLIPYTPMIVTLASTIYSFQRCPGYPKYAKTFNNKIDWWYWSSIFSTQYDKSTDNKIALHVNKLVEWTHPTKGIKDKWNSHRIDINYLKQTLKRLYINTDARYKAILCLPLVSFNHHDILGNPIENLEDHHYFTTENLKNIGLESDLINNIANRIAIDKSSNASIGKISPHEYKDHNISVSKKQLVRYIIPSIDNNMKELSKDKYKNFLRDRRNLIIEEIKEKIKSP